MCLPHVSASVCMSLGTLGPFLLSEWAQAALSRKPITQSRRDRNPGGRRIVNSGALSPALKCLSSLRYAPMNHPNMTIYDNGRLKIVQQEERRLHTHKGSQSPLRICRLCASAPVQRLVPGSLMSDVVKKLRLSSCDCD